MFGVCPRRVGRCYPPPMAEQAEVTVRDYRPADGAAVVRVLTDALIDFPALQLMVGTDDGAHDRLSRLMALGLGVANSSAIVAETDGRIVGALTYADLPACSAMSPSLMLRLMRIAGRRMFSTVRIFSKIERVHPRTPHRHLPTVGVDTARQRSGIGSGLMDEYNRRCDESGLSGYLETIRWSDSGKPSHERFYGRLGFVIEAEIPVDDEPETPVEALV